MISSRITSVKPFSKTNAIIGGKMFTSEKSRKMLLVIVILTIYIVLGMTFVEMAAGSDSEVDFIIHHSKPAKSIQTKAGEFGRNACEHIKHVENYQGFELRFVILIGNEFAEIQYMLRDLEERLTGVPMSEEEYSKMVNANAKAFVEGFRPGFKELYEMARVGCNDS